MYYFKLLCETVTYGDIIENGNFEEKQFFAMANEANSIVFYDLDDVVKDRTRFDLSQPLPFKTCAFEFHGNNSIVRFDGNLISCILAEEIGPGKLNIYYSILQEDEHQMRIIECLNDNADNHVFHKIISVCLLAINEMSHGASDPNSFIRIKNSKGNKAKKFIRKVVHICPKLKSNTLATSHGIVINWSHRWEVRGHWRNIDGLGKDRSGEYCIMNKTWVIDHIKGPEDLPIIRKVRSVQPNHNEVIHG